MKFCRERQMIELCFLATAQPWPGEAQGPYLLAATFLLGHRKGSDEKTSVGPASSAAVFEGA